MTHAEYLEKHHEIANAVFSAVALKLAQGVPDEAEEIVTRARTKLDSLWDEMRATVERGVNP